MNRTARTIAVSGIALAGFAVAAPAFASATPLRTTAAQADLVSQVVVTPTAGAGAQLMNDGPAGAPDYGRPDTYIGTTDDGLLAAPFTPGSSRSYTVQFSNAGNVTETMTVANVTAGADSYGDAPVPASWISFTAPTASLAPGATESVPVTVTIPAGTRAGLYGGTLMGSASAPGSGNIKLVTGAGIREYLTVS